MFYTFFKRSLSSGNCVTITDSLSLSLNEQHTHPPTASLQHLNWPLISPFPLNIKIYLSINPQMLLTVCRFLLFSSILNSETFHSQRKSQRWAQIQLHCVLRFPIYILQILRLLFFNELALPLKLLMHPFPIDNFIFSLKLSIILLFPV